MKTTPRLRALLFALATAVTVTPLSAIKITVPDQYQDQVEAIKEAERKERQQELEGVAESAEGGIEIAGEDKPEPEKPAVDADEFLVQSVIEATDTAEAMEASLAADEGIVSGQVIDKETGEPVSGAAILIEGTDVATVTDATGRYSLGPAPAGIYTLSFIKTGYIEANITEYQVAGGEVSVFPFAMPPRPADMSDEVYELQDFTVTAEEANQLMALIDMKQASIGQVSFLSAEDFSKFAGSNVADLVGRLAGVNVVEGQFAVVRGLGDRYNSTLVNGLPVPSPDPVRQGVQLDLFPTSVVENVVVDKAFIPSLPSNSSGAAFNLATKSYPEELTAWFETGFSVNENAQDALLLNRNIEPFQGTPGGKNFDFKSAIGREDLEPSGEFFAGLKDSVGNGLLDFGGQSYKLGLGNSFETPWGGVFGLVGSMSYGSSSSTSIGTQQDRYGQVSTRGRRGRTGLAGSGVDGTLPGRGLEYDFMESTVSEDAAFLAGAGLTLDADGNHNLDLTYLRSRSNISQATRRENGFLTAGGSRDPDRGFPQNTSSSRTLAALGREIVGRGFGDTLTQGQDILSFEQRTLEVTQFAGEHKFEDFGLNSVTFGYGISSNKATSAIGNPDPNNFVGGQTSLFYLQNVSGNTLSGSFGTPSVTLSELIPDGGFLFGGDTAVSDGFTEDVVRNTARTIEDNHDAYRGDIDFVFNDRISAKLGVAEEELDREVVQRDEIIQINNDNVISGATRDELVQSSLASINTSDRQLDSFALISRQVNDHYLEFDWAVFDQLDLSFGVRHSKVNMSSTGTSSLVPGFPLTGTSGSFTEAILAGNANLTNGNLLGFGSSDPNQTVVSGRINESFLLPALTARFALTDFWVLRFSYAQTYALPSPRELSPVFTVDTFTGDRVVGNPTLTPSDVNNFGFRIERSFDDPDTSLSLSLFAKQIEKPVEQIGLNHSVTGIDVQSFINNENTADVYGVELEGRLGFGLIHRSFDGANLNFLQYFSIGGNIALIEATVEYPDSVVQSYVNENNGTGIFIDADGNLLIPSERRLFDQPEWTANFDVSFDHPEWGTSVTAAVYAQSEVLSSVGTGSSLSVDQFTASFYQLDLTFRQTFGDGWELSFGVENLTDTSRGIAYSQDVVDEEIERFSYKLGRTYSVSLEYTF